MRKSSIVIQISVALACIVVVAITTMLTSYWLSDKADDDAQAINIAGSLRVQSYTVGLLANQASTNEALEQAVARLEQTWEHPIFSSLLRTNPDIATQHQEAYTHWQDTQQVLLTQNANTPVHGLLQDQITLLDQLVGSIQQHAEDNARALRLVQVAALLLTLLFSGIVIYWLKVKVERPLSDLTQVAKRVAQGDFAYRIPVQQLDELGFLATALNRMSDAISHMHEQMEEQIEQQTQALQRSNITLQFLYDTARSIIEHEPQDNDYRRLVSRLTELVEAEDIELCLMTEAGDSPYLQVTPEQSAKGPCITRNCDECLGGEMKTEWNSAGNAAVCRYSFPMLREQQHYGVLVCRMAAGKELDHWQQQLIQSVADQLAIALSLQSQEDNSRRLSLVHERTVIARELHDSLAQALSYLKIQVTRLNRAIDKQDKSMLEDVSGELQEGLTSAYRQLRELLTTFRLKGDELGLLNALQTSVKQLGEQTDMEISLDYALSNLPLSPNEEIHLVQIIREASQNAIHHSQGKHVTISLHEDSLKNVRLSIEDDGVGIPETPEKLNHYGLAIMLERGKHLGGELTIERRESGGTGVYFRFTPDYLKHRKEQAQLITRSA